MTRGDNWIVTWKLRVDTNHMHLHSSVGVNNLPRVVTW